MSDAGHEGVGHAGFDEWLDALERGEPYYLECTMGHGSLPPRRVCPECGEDELDRTALPEVGDVETYTVTHVATPSFDADTPYVTAVANFGPVRLSGIVDTAPEDVETGLTVHAAVIHSETTSERVVGLRPR